MGLDLYAKIEPYIGFYDHYERLYGHYLKIIREYNPKSILDVGCGNGRMLQKLGENGFSARGIDLSKKMVEIAKKKGVDAREQNISEVDEQFDMVIAVADVLNYMDKKELSRFLGYIKKALKNGGIFLCDVNTEHGFCDVADGTMIKEDSEIFLAIDAVYDDGVLDTNITLFEKEGDLYKKHTGTILQHYHTKEELIDLTPLEYIGEKEVSLFSNDVDKMIYIFKNV